MQNVEYKAELRDPALARAICAKIAADHIATLEQTDTYFRVARGRLKRREAVVIEGETRTPEPAELIYYDRADRPDQKISKYSIYSEEEAAAHFGANPKPIWLVVKKTREFYMHNNVRIHLDDVQDLGRFIEFEALVSKNFNIIKSRQANQLLIATFTPAMGEAIAKSYSDMIATELETTE